MANEVAVIPLLDELSPLQRAFVTHPLALTDPELALIQSGASAWYAKRQATALRRELMFYIQAGETAAAIRRSITPTAVLEELNNLAFSDVLDYFEVVDTRDEKNQVTGSMLVPKQNLRALPPAARRLIKKLKFGTVVDINGVAHVFIDEIELHGKEWALKEIIELLRLKQTGAPKDETAELMQFMDAKDLELIEQLFTKAADRKRLEKKGDVSATT